MKKIVAFGTLREDVVIEYDFSVPMKEMEVKLNKLDKTVGGSVNNTCYYLALKDSKLQVVLCTLNYIDLVGMLKKRMSCVNYRISTTQEALLQYPVSFIGLRENGEKQMISYDPIIDDSLLIDLLKKDVIDAEVLYTSFYEINERNYSKIATIFNKVIGSGKTIMVDLCPTLNRLSDVAIKEILSSTTVVSGNENEFKIMLKMLGQGGITDVFSEFPTIERIYVKKGERGASLYINDKQEKIDEIHIDAVVSDVIKNTTGCGDVFNAVIIEGMINTKDYQKTLECAVKVSGKIAEGGLPWIKE